MDKALIMYRGKSMYQHAAQIIWPFCNKVFISCRKEQETFILEYPAIFDRLPSRGPLTGLLSAFLQFPNVAWLLVPVDMPNLTTEFIHEYVISNRDIRSDATIIRDQLATTIQPLVGIYEPASLKKINQQYQSGLYSLKHLVEKLRVHLVDFNDDQQYLANYNNPQDWSES